jgi:plasmid stabilization system protein ParE
MTAEFLPDAQEEMVDAARFYEEKAAGIGIAFLLEVHKAVSKIVDQPLSAPEIRGNIRKKVIRRFPYNLLYTVEEDVIVIIAVAHQKRAPSYWHKRS